MSLAPLATLFSGHPLTKAKPLAAWLRFAHWQVASRIAKRPLERNWIEGSKLLVRAGDAGLTGNLYVGLHEFDEMAFVLHFLRAEDHFFDVGANMGSYTVLAGKVVGAKTTSFEPVPSTFKRLTENVKLNNLESTSTAVMKAVGSAPGTIKFTSSHDAMNRALSDGENSEDSIEVEVTTLDQTCQESVPILMKIDVEGYETEVLQGARSVLQNSNLKAVIMETNGLGRFFGQDSQTITEMMAGHGLNPFAYNPLEKKLIPLTEPKTEDNTVFVKDLAFVQARLNGSRKFTVLGTSF